MGRLVRMMATAAIGARPSLLRAAWLEALAIALGAIGPYALKLLIDDLDRPHETSLHLQFCVLLFVGCWVGASTVDTARLARTAEITDALTRHMTIEALACVLPAITAARDSHSGRAPGLLERLPYSLSLVVEGVIWRGGPAFLQCLTGFLVIASLISWTYVALLAITLLGFVVAASIGSVRNRVHADAANSAASQVSHNTGDIVRNARRVVLNGALDHELARTATMLDLKRRATADMCRSMTLMAALQCCILGCGLAALLILAALDVAGARMSTGDFVLIQTYAFRSTVSLSSLGPIIAQAGVAIANIRDVMELANAPKAPDIPEPPVSDSADLVATHVSFRYRTDQPVIEDVSLRIDTGSFAVIVGCNGSGKSTLAQILAGVLAPSSGKIEIAETNVAAIPWRERYRHVLYAPQFIGLFNRSLRENALYHPARQSAAGVEDLLVSWRFKDPGTPIDFEMKLGEQGERLSGGQIQKLELARLAGLDVPILILDESTSALDPRSEMNAVSVLRQRRHGTSTLVMISHRMEIARAADQVLFMHDGRLAATGTHAMLMERYGAYRSLWSVGLEEGSVIRKG
ncbi:ABC transporter ATP-binding protein [Novosphingobium sp. HR1a]|nr:ABC transporter ATP-binding protein [Novosphingobium sp. HR1a]